MSDYTLVFQDNRPIVNITSTGPQGVQGIPGPAGPAGTKGESALSYNVTSTNTVGNGSGVVRTLFIGPSAYSVGDYVRLTSTAASNRYMTGTVTENDGTALSIDIDYATGGASSTYHVSPTGRQGLKGEPGDSVGLPGPKGDQGEPGPVGPQGPTGNTGATGPKGDTGNPGPQGLTGERGLQGLAGTPGEQGPAGAKGDTGATGAQGPKGDTGSQGPKGDQGLQGIQGIQGTKGDTGTAGAKGDTGDTGPAGPGVAAGGTTNQFLIKSSSTNYATTWSSKLNAVYTGTASGDHTIAAIQNATAGDNISALNVSSINEQFSSMQVTGREIDTGTIKVSHVKPASGTSDANAAALSIDLKGTGTAAQGIVVDSTEGGTTGDLLKLRNNGAFLVTVKSDGKMGIGTGLNTPGGKLEVRQTDDTLPGVVIQANSTTSADLLQFKNSAAQLRTNINRTGDLVVRSQAYLQNLQVVGTSTDFGGGNGVIGMKNANTVPTTNPTGGVIVYSDAGVLKYRQPDGTVVSVGSGGTGTALSYNGTSTSSVAVGTGSKTFTVESGLSFVAGNYVRVASTATPTTYMAGNVTSYSGTSLVINATESNGTGTLASWSVGLTGARGATGTTGSAGTLLTSTSSTSNTIGSGSKTFTTAASMTGATVGQWVLITNTGTPANFMRGQVTALSGTSITINVTETGGSGTFTAWTLSVTGATGAQGPKGDPGDAGSGGGGTAPATTTFADARSSSLQTIPSQAFTTISLPDEATDLGNNYNPSTSMYTIPATGLYQCTGMVRIEDGHLALKNFGMGIHSDNSDGAWFQWSVTRDVNLNPTRQSLAYQRTAQFTAGAQVRLYVWAGSETPLQGAQLTVMRVG